MDRKLDEAELVWKKTDGTKYDFNCFALPLKFIEKIYNHEIALDEAIEDQTKSKILINKLNNTTLHRSPPPPKKTKNKKQKANKQTKKTDEKHRVLECAINLSDVRDEIINLFEKGIFL